MEIGLIIIFVQIIVIFLAILLFIKPVKNVLRLATATIEGVGSSVSAIIPAATALINIGTQGFEHGAPYISAASSSITSVVDNSIDLLSIVIDKTGYITTTITGQVGNVLNTAISSLNYVAPLLNVGLTAGFEAVADVTKVTGDSLVSVMPYISDAVILTLDSLNQGVIVIGSVVASIGGNVSNVIDSLDGVLSEAIESSGKFINILLNAVSYVVDVISTSIEVIFKPISMIASGVQTLAETVSWIIEQVTSIWDAIESLDPGSWF